MWTAGKAWHHLAQWLLKAYNSVFWQWLWPESPALGGAWLATTATILQGAAFSPTPWPEAFPSSSSHKMFEAGWRQASNAVPKFPSWCTYLLVLEKALDTVTCLSAMTLAWIPSIVSGLAGAPPKLLHCRELLLPQPHVLNPKRLFYFVLVTNMLVTQWCFFHGNIICCGCCCGGWFSASFWPCFMASQLWECIVMNY